MAPTALIVQGLQGAGAVSVREFGLSGAAALRGDRLYPRSVSLQARVPAHHAAPLPLQAALDLRPPRQRLPQLRAVNLDLPLQVGELALPHAGLRRAAQRRQHQARGRQRGHGAPVGVQADLRRRGEAPQAAQAEPPQAEAGAPHHAGAAAHGGRVRA